jgi:hypothetical protein
LAEQCWELIDSGAPAVASTVTINELKIACSQVINQLLKTEHFTINEKMGERIPNGTILGLYEDIPVVTYNGKSKCSLPIKPLKLPRNMGVFAIYPKYTLGGNYEYDKEFIPLQMGQAGLLKSQPLLNDLLGQVGYENFGMEIIFTKDIKQYFPDVVLAMRLAIMDISQYGDYDPLPVLPEMEFTIIQEVYKLYVSEKSPEKLVDSTAKETQSIPLRQQQQS